MTDSILDILHREKSINLLYPPSSTTPAVVLSLHSSLIGVLVTFLSSNEWENGSGINVESYTTALRDHIVALKAERKSVEVFIVDNPEFFNDLVGNISLPPNLYIIYLVSWWNIVYLGSLDNKTYYTSYLSDLPELRLLIMETIMTPDQAEELSKKVRIENAIINNPKSSSLNVKTASLHLNSKAVGNFLYPEDYRKEYSKISRPRDVLPDLPEPRGWLDKQVLDNLNEYSPKFKTLINAITMTIDQGVKYYIFSKFVNHHGITLLSSLLNLAKVDNIVISGSDNAQSRKNKIESFNSGKIKVLLTTIVPTEQTLVRDPDVLVILEGIESGVFFPLLRAIYKQGNFKSRDSLSILFPLALNPSGADTPDKVSYEEIATAIDSMSGDYNRALSGAGRLIMKKGKIYG